MQKEFNRQHTCIQKQLLGTIMHSVRLILHEPKCVLLYYILMPFIIHTSISEESIWKIIPVLNNDAVVNHL